MKKKLLILSCLLLNGCVIEQYPAAPISSAENEKVEQVEILKPKSESLPLTPYPKNITTQYYDNNVTLLNDANNEVNNNEVNNNEVNNNEVNNNEVNNNEINQAPIGSFNNPIKFSGE